MNVAEYGVYHISLYLFVYIYMNVFVKFFVYRSFYIYILFSFFTYTDIRSGRCRSYHVIFDFLSCQELEGTLQQPRNQWSLAFEDKLGCHKVE